MHLYVASVKVHFQDGRSKALLLQVHLGLAKLFGGYKYTNIKPAGAGLVGG